MPSSNRKTRRSVSSASVSSSSRRRHHPRVEERTQNDYHRRDRTKINLLPDRKAPSVTARSSSSSVPLQSKRLAADIRSFLMYFNQ